MVKTSDADNDNWLKAKHLQGRDITVVIESARIHEFDDRSKGGGKKKQIALKFRGKEKELGLNKTNTGRIERAYGDDTDFWVGKSITLYPDETEMNGELVPCIRVRIPAKGAVNEKPAEKVAESKQPAAAADLDDEIPF